MYNSRFTSVGWIPSIHHDYQKPEFLNPITGEGGGGGGDSKALTRGSQNEASDACASYFGI